MKKTTILFLIIGIIAVFSVMYAISAYKGDAAEKASTQAVKAEVLAATKAALGSVPPPMNVRSLALTRSRVAASRTAEAVDETADTNADGDTCTGEGVAHAVNTFTPGGDDDWYCLENLCPGAIIRIDLDSAKLGAPTDTYLEVYEDCAGGATACRDDGNGFSGVTTDSCVMVTAPDTGKIWFRVINLADVCIDPAGGDCTYEVNVTLTSKLETEDNGGCPGEDFMYKPPVLATGSAADETADANADTDICLRDDDEGMVSGVIGVDGDVDNFNVCLYGGEVLVAGLEAGKCNNECDGALFDPALGLYFYDPINQICTPVATADDIDDLDPALHYTAAQSGLYVISVSEHFAVGSADDLYNLNAEIYQGEADRSNTCDGATCLSFEAGPTGGCPCNGFRNHGGYVVCVLRMAKTMLRAGEIDHDTFSDMVSEAAQSDCSQPDIHSGKGDHSGWDGSSKNKDIPKPPHP